MNAVSQDHPFGPQRLWPRRPLLSWSLRARVLVVLAVSVAVWGWVDVRLRGTVDPNDPGIHKTDFTVYTEAGAAFFDGRRPYEVTNPRGWGYLYPPPFAMLVAPLHALPPRGQVLVWFAISALMVYGCYSECVRIARAILPADEERGLFGPIPNWIGSCAVVAALLPALNCLQRGQVGVAKLYLLLLGFRLCVAGPSRLRALLGGIVLALPIALKVTPLLPVGVLLLQQGLAAWHGQARRTELARAAASASGVGLGLAFSLLLLPAALIGWRANLEHLDTWWHAVALQAEESMDDSFAGDSSSPRNQSFSNAVQLLGNWGDYYFAGGPLDKDPMPRRRHGQQFLMDARVVHFALLLARAALGCLLLATSLRVACTRDRLALAATFGLACVATLLVAPIGRGHYYVLLLPAVLFASAWLWHEGHTRLAVWSAIAPAALSVTHYVALDFAGRIGLLGVGTTVWYVLVCTAILSQAKHSVAPRKVTADVACAMPPAKTAVAALTR